LIALRQVILALLLLEHIKRMKAEAELCSRSGMAPSINAGSDCQPAKDQNTWAVAKMSIGLTIRAPFLFEARASSEAALVGSEIV
jgi:hypothetical protein